MWPEHHRNLSTSSFLVKTVTPKCLDQVQDSLKPFASTSSLSCKTPLKLKNTSILVLFLWIQFRHHRWIVCADLRGDFRTLAQPSGGLAGDRRVCRAGRRQRRGGAGGGQHRFSYFYGQIGRRFIAEQTQQLARDPSRDRKDVPGHSRVILLQLHLWDGQNSALGYAATNDANYNKST